jgi:hypothetical protein
MDGAYGMHGRIRNIHGVLVRNLKERYHSEDLSVDDRIFEWILRKDGEKLWSECFWLRIVSCDGLL